MLGFKLRISSSGRICLIFEMSHSPVAGVSSSETDRARCCSVGGPYGRSWLERLSQGSLYMLIDSPFPTIHPINRSLPKSKLLQPCDIDEVAVTVRMSLSRQYLPNKTQEGIEDFGEASS